MNESADGVGPIGSVSGGASLDLIDLLEERVARLVERHREARKTISDLRGQLKERESRIGDLTDKVYTLGRVRDEAHKRVDELISRIDRLEGKT